MRRALLPTLMALAACGGIAPDDAPLATSEQPVFDGTPTDAYEEVVFVFTVGSACSGVLVAPHVVLTAAQCVTNLDLGPSCVQSDPLANPPMVTVAFGSEVPIGGDGPMLTDLMPIALAPAGICHNDLALITLPKAVASSYATPRTVRATAVTASEAITLIGYGRTSSGSSAGTKTFAEGTVDCVNTDCAFYDSGDHAIFQSVDVAGCEADGGAPTLDGDGNIIGLSSYGPAGCGVGANAGYTDATRFADWIDGTVSSIPTPAEIFDPDAGGGGGGGGAGAGGAGTGGDANGEGGADTGGGAGGSDGSGEPLPATSDDDGGCAVSTAGSRSSSPAGLVALMMGLAMMARRRRSG